VVGAFTSICGDKAALTARCDEGSAVDCGNLGYCYSGLALGVPWTPDPGLFLRYSTRGCELGSAVACTNLGEAYRFGAGAPANAALAEGPFARALSIVRAGCDAGHGSDCHMLSHAYQRGDGVPRDESRARELEERSCALGDVLACIVRMLDAREANQTAEEVRRAARVCELGCWCDPVLSARERGSPAAARAVADWRARCIRGDSVACAAAALVEKRPSGQPPRTRFRGNAALSADELDAVVEIDKPDGLLAQGRTRAEVLERDTLVLSAFYYDHGYLDVRIETPTLSPADTQAFTDVEWRIVEGARYRIGKLTIGERDPAGRPVAPLRGGLRSRIAARDGDWFSRADLVRDLAVVQRLYRDAGYGDVKVEPQLTQDAGRAVVDIDIPVHRGPVIHLDYVVIEGNRRIPTQTIRAAIGIADGDTFSETRLDEARSRLRTLGPFRRVDLTTEAAPNTTHWTLHVDVEERMP
jgi:hypothetical protein